MHKLQKSCLNRYKAPSVSYSLPGAPPCSVHWCPFPIGWLINRGLWNYPELQHYNRWSRWFFTYHFPIKGRYWLVTYHILFHYIPWHRMVFHENPSENPQENPIVSHYIKYYTILLYILISLYIYICIFIFIYIYMYIYKYLYIYISIPKNWPALPESRDRWPWQALTDGTSSCLGHPDDGQAYGHGYVCWFMWPHLNIVTKLP